MRLTEENIGIEDIAVRASDTDRFYDATIPFFFSSSQELAGEHATLFGMGISEMYEKEMRTWVIVRTRMDFTRIPKWREKLTFETFPQKGYKLFCPRVVMARDEKGEPVMNAMTHWVLMDLSRKRPIPAKMVEERFNMKYEDRFQNPDIGKLLKYEEAEKIEVFEEKTFCPNYFDIDLNRHVNNLSYINWCLDALPDSLRDEYKPSLADVRWIRQCFRHDNLTVVVRAESAGELEKEEPVLWFDIIRTEESGASTKVFDALIKWKKRALCCS